MDLLVHQANGRSYDTALTYAKQAADCMERGGKVTDCSASDIGDYAVLTHSSATDLSQG